MGGAGWYRYRALIHAALKGPASSLLLGYLASAYSLLEREGWVFLRHAFVGGVCLSRRVRHVRKPLRLLVKLMGILNVALFLICTSHLLQKMLVTGVKALITFLW